MQTNGVLTVFNPHLVGHDIKLFGCVVQPAWVFYKKVVAVNVPLSEESSFIARVPFYAGFSKKYIDPHGYEESDPEKYFTLAPGTFVVMDIIDTAETTMAELTKGRDVVTLTKVAYNDFGSAPNRHWRLEGS